MGSDDIFKKRREARKQRRHEYRNPKADSFLIVTEGEKTEPFYFEGMKKLIEEKLGGNIEIAEVPVIEVSGEGCSTKRLIEVAEQIIKKAKIFYQNVWLVFDKDDFEDFDQAIIEGEKKGYKIAWSNQSFEYWLYLHFNYSDSALHRDEWIKKLDEIFKQYGLGEGRYRKNYDNIYQLVDTYGGVDIAIKYAKNRMAGYNEDVDRPSDHDPGTTVHILVEELKRYLDEQ